MAKGDMDDFLKGYYRRLHTSSMDDDVLARLVDNKKKGLLTTEQESWFKDGFIEEDNDPYNELKYRAAEPWSLSDTENLHEDQLIKLYERLAKAMYAMKSASALYAEKDKDIKTDFVDYYIDELNLFPKPHPTNECLAAIKDVFLPELDETGKGPDEVKAINGLKQRIADTARDTEGKLIFEGKIGKVNDFIKDKLQTEKYKDNTAVQTKLKAIAKGLSEDYRQSTEGRDFVWDSLANQKFINAIDTIHQDSSFTEVDESDLKTNLDKFRNYGGTLLSTLYTNQRVRDKFANHDADLIEIITKKAEGRISYHDPNSADYVTPKADDVLNPPQQIKKWATDTYKNSIRKYARLRGDPLLFSGFSKEICKAIDKAEVKPTDGLNGLISKADAIKKHIPNKTVMEHFDWFLTTMGEINKNYPKAVDGAWKNAKQMQCVITQIILKASGPKATDEDMEKAKTTMEIMTAMKYGMMTSRTFEALKQTDLSLFGDGNLSWNKNEGIQFVTKAFDKSIKFALNTVGLGATIIRNKLFVYNGKQKFKGKNNAQGTALGKRMAEEDKRLASREPTDKAAYVNKINEAKTSIAKKQSELNNLKNQEGIEESTLGAKQTEINQRKAKMEAQKAKVDGFQSILDSKQESHDKYENNKNILDEYNNIKTIISNLNKDQANKKNEIIALRKRILDPNTYVDPVTGMAMGETEKKEKDTELNEELKKLQTEYDKITNNLNGANAKNTPTYFKNTVIPAMDENKTLQADYDTYEQAKKDCELANNDYTTMENEYSDLNNKVQQFTDATKEIEGLNKTIAERQAALDNWPQNNRNKVEELENFWNFLQTGKTKTWSLSTKRAQTKFDKNKDQLFAEYVAKHGVRAD